MARAASTQPTEVELQILRILWEHGASPSRLIHEELSKTKDTNYSTTVKMLSVMLDKGLVKRNDSVRPQLFRAAASQERTQRRILGDVIRKVYGGSAKSLVLQALSAKSASDEDLDEIRRLIDKLTKSSSA